MRLVNAILAAVLALLFCTLIVSRGFAAEPEDFKELKKRADEGNPQAELALGVMYDFGDGVPQNYELAVKWYQRAANHGSPVAQNNLGAMYLQGQGVPKDVAQAAKWIQLSAKQGYARAQMNLGHLHSEGSGVRQSFSDALYWFQRAANQGDAAAERALGNVHFDGKVVRPDYVQAYKWFSLAAAQGDDDARKQRDELADRMTPAAVSESQRLATAFVPVNELTAKSDAPKSSGTGFFVTKDGYFVTANHVIENASRIVIRMRNIVLAARAVKVDKANDLALLKITGAFPRGALTNSSLLQLKDSQLGAVAPKFVPLAVVNSIGAKLGDTISTIGFPIPELQGSEPKFTRGEINGIAGIKDDPHYFQVSAPIQPGNSGGPLLDRSGNVVGIVQKKLNDLTVLMASGTVPQNVNYALKSAYLLGFLRTVPGIALAGPRAGDESAQADWIAEAQSSVAIVLVY